MIVNIALNSEQLKAIKHNTGPLLIIAGAGTGKTTVITERIKYLILKKNISPSQILALTFTDKAAREMEERVDIALPYGYTQMWISTFHAFCDKVLKNEAIHIGLNPSYKLLAEAEAILLLRKNLFKFDLTYFRPLGNPNKFLEGMLQHFSRLKDEDVSLEEYLRYSRKLEIRNPKLKISMEEIEKIKELANAYKTYEELKIKEGVMDFSDLISNTLKLFRERLNILKFYQEQFRYILVDEFQDTNFAQNQLAILLAGRGKNITVVGDDDQAIYRWRGAAISNIIQFKKDFPKGKTITLNRNYRSTQEILNVSYRLIQHNNPDRLEAKEKISKKLKSIRGITGDKVEFIFGQRVEDEADLVSEKIMDFIEKKNSRITYKDIAILVRANDHSVPFQRALSRKNIPFQFLGPGQLFHQEEIKDLIAYLKVLYNVEDSVSLYRVLNMGIFHLNPIDIASMLSFARRKNYTLFEMLNKIEETFLNEDFKERLKKLVKIIKSHIKRIPKDTAGQILYYFLEDCGLIKKYLESKSVADERKSQNISRFFDKLKTYEAQHEDASIYSVVDWIDLSMQMGESLLAANIDWVENNAVNILTVHSSKGLEFPIVFLVNLVSQRFPTRERKEQIPIPQEFIKEMLPSGDYHLQEERRLFYVGMTRAKDNLFLSSANYYGEGKRERKISPFVYEIFPQDHVNKIIQKGKVSKDVDQLSFLELSQRNNPPSIFNIPSSAPLTYLSYSQIQTFEICPLHYRLRYLLKVPTPQTSAQSFGTSIHATLRDFYQKLIRYEKASIEDITLYLKKNWINEGYASKAHEKNAINTAEKLIKNYLRNNLNKKNLPLSLELPFMFSIKNPASQNLSLKIGGRIDRIDRLDANKIEILDYKTGGNVPKEKTLKDNIQLTIYALAATQVPTLPLNRKAENVVLSLYFLEKDIKLTTLRNVEELEVGKEFLLEKAKEIVKSDFTCSHSTFCQNCEYKILCTVS